MWHRRVLFATVLVLLAPRQLHPGCGCLPAPVEREFFLRQAAIFLDKNPPVAERVAAIQAFASQRPGFLGSPEAADVLGELIRDPAAPLAVRVAATEFYFPGPDGERANRGPRSRKHRQRLSPLMHEALSSNDELVHRAFSRVGRLLTPVAAARALGHRSHWVRMAGQTALTRLYERRPGKLCDTSAEVLRPILDDLQHWRGAGVLRWLRNDTGRFDIELLLLLRSGKLERWGRERALALLNAPVGAKARPAPKEGAP